MRILFPSKITGDGYMKKTNITLPYEDRNGENGLGVIPGWLIKDDRGVSKNLMDDIRGAFNDDIEITICNPISSEIKLIKEDSGPYTFEEIISHISEKEKLAIEEQLEGADGVVFQGGVICDWYEVAFAALASMKGIPMLGICAGQSEIILGTGGSIKKVDNIDKHLRIFDEEVHCLCPTGEDSLPFAPIINKNFLVNSIHARCIDLVSPLCSKICATDDDGNLEIVCGDNIITTRFHPEGLTKNLEKKALLSEVIFGNFRELVNQYANDKIKL